MRKIINKIVFGVLAAVIALGMILPGQAQAAPSSQELQEQINELLRQVAQIQQLLDELAGFGTGTLDRIPSGFRFTRNLSRGMSGADVRHLQIVMNSDPDTRLAMDGPGSLGNETQFFGPLTRNAVIKFQEKYAGEVLAPWGISRGTGFVGSTTRAKLNSILVRHQQAKVRVTNPSPNEIIASPLMITGEARGTWFFEATFPVKLLDGNGNTIAVGFAQAQADWMTTNFVPFLSSLAFDVPATSTGTLVLEKDNPSGLPENDAEVLIPVRFQ